MISGNFFGSGGKQKLNLLLAELSEMPCELAIVNDNSILLINILNQITVYHYG